MPNRLDDALRRVLTDPTLFSRLVIAKRELRPYQIQVQKAILASVFEKQGLSFSFMMARQMGKNETIAQLECYLLNLFQRVGGQIIHAAPTFNPQCVMAKARLDEAMDNPWNAQKFKSEWGRAIVLGKARTQFLSGDPQANKVGLTASILLAGDEFQDWTHGVWEKDFCPMGSTTHTTRVVWGTAWADDDPLAVAKNDNLAAQKRDGIRRHFEFDWQTLAAISPAYRAFVESEIARLGEDHPIIRTQYKLLTIGSGGRLLSPMQLSQMQGQHAPETQRANEDIYVAGLDLAGEEEGAPSVSGLSALSSRDAVTLSIGHITYRDLAPGLTQPVCQIVARYSWTGQKHAALYGTLLDLLKRLWRVDRVCVDATGVGAGVASFLETALTTERVEKCVFDSAWSFQSNLAFNFLAMINSGRYLEYTPNDEIAKQAWRQFKLAKSKTRPGNKMMVHVEEKDGHDDLLISAALCAYAATRVEKHVEPAAAISAPDKPRERSKF